MNRRSLSVGARTNYVLLSTMSKNVAPAVAGTRGPLSFQPPSPLLGMQRCKVLFYRPNTHGKYFLGEGGEG